MKRRADLYKDGKLNLVFIAGGEINLNASIGGSLRRYIVRREMDVNGLARLVCIKARREERDLGRYREVIDAIQGQRLREVSPGEVKKVFSAIGLKREEYLYLPLVDNWRDELSEEMREQGYKDFSDKALRRYMTNRILADLCKK